LCLYKRIAANHESLLSEANPKKPSNRFHGRVEGIGEDCAHPGCREPGEFRAPNPYNARADFEGPGSYRWLCFDHVREFNSSYNFFNGMSREEIEDAQMPFAGWQRETRAFAQGGIDSPPKWQDFHDPLDAISARFRGRMPKDRPDGQRLSGADRDALHTLGLGADADRKALRSRYLELVRKYHPDRNGGDRSFEKKLRGVIDAYQYLTSSPLFA
jgi:DnaJ domain